MKVSRVHHIAEDRPFLEIRRDSLRAEYTDGTLSEPFTCETVVRPRGVDAVAVAIYCKGPRGIQVLLRRCLRPAISLVRPQLDLPVPEFRAYRPCLLEAVAGVIEAGDKDLAGIEQRAAIEVLEEAGYSCQAQDMTFLGYGGFPSPGMSPERIWYQALDVTGMEPGPLEGDGSIFEVGGSTEWMGLDDAIEACIDGRIEDMKTEVVFRRLAEHIEGHR